MRQRLCIYTIQKMKGSILFLWLLIAGVQVSAFAWTPTQADTGFYLRSQLGINFAQPLALRAGDNDRASRCDAFVNPRHDELDGCTTADRSTR